MPDFDYDISNYTDEELINEILELDNNITDRVLETKILQEIRDYQGLTDVESQKMYKFYEDMYDRFFTQDEYIQTEIKNPDGTLRTQTMDPASEDYRVMQQQRNAILENRIQDVSDTNTNTPKFNVNRTIDRTPNSIGIMDFSANLSKTATQNTYSIDYPTSKINPIVRQTMFKMLSIDSQFRDDYYNTSATSFTMNLSTPITDVISMKLYSVQIPYTWYTINNNFGSNFIFFKGNSPGINNGDHDIQIKIPSGNYDATTLMTAINTRITTLSSGYSTSAADPYDFRDLSFGQTRVAYDSTTVKTRFEIDFKKVYNESDYHMSFPYYTSPQDLVNNVNSIPGFLGFNNQTYDLFIAYSDLRVATTADSVFTVDASNSYFDIIKYQGSDAYTNDSVVIETYRIDITGYATFGTSISNTNLVSYFNTALQNSPYIDPLYSSFIKVLITDPNNINNTWTHYEIKVKLNKKTTQNVENSKIVVKFPFETQAGAHVWTGYNSCFKFITEICEICEITTETPTLLTNYVIYNDAQIVIDCVKPYYDVSENTRIATLLPSPAEGYLQKAYISAVSNSLVAMNNATKIPIYKPNGEFNNTNTHFDILNSRAHFQFDINRVFDQTSYIIDLSGSILSKNPFFFNSTIDDLSLSSFTINKQITGLSSYTVDDTSNKIRIYTKSSSNGYTNFGNQNVPALDITIPNKTYNTIEQLIDAFNESFGVAEDDDGDRIAGACFFLYQFTESGIIDLTLSFQIQKVITEKDYKVSFVDPSGSWVNYLYMTDASYHLVNYTNGGNYANIYGSENFYKNTILITNNNNKIKFEPYINGVADSTGANDIYMTITPSATEYTRQDLIDELNRQVALTMDPQDSTVNILQGTTFELITNGNKQYTKLRLNIDKTFRARDYKLVIYDAESFVYCNVGVTNSQNIRNSTFDSTLGWLLGFHSFTEYDLIDFTTIDSETAKQNSNYSNNVYSGDSTFNSSLPFSYSYNSTNKKIAVIGDAILNTNLYNYFLIVLDDFVQSHVSDGLITVASAEKDVALPSYAMRAQYICEPIPGSALTRKVAVSGTSKLNTNLTAKQLYAMNQLYETRQTRNRSYSAGPSLKDVFAIVPLKLSGTPGGTYVEFGGTLQNQDRKYFGPVRIQKLSIKLMNDKGDVVDLNGADWSITIVCEIMTNERPKT
jgi:hypothetical protein